MATLYEMEIRQGRVPHPDYDILVRYYREHACWLTNSPAPLITRTKLCYRYLSFPFTPVWPPYQ